MVDVWQQTCHTWRDYKQLAVVPGRSSSRPSLTFYFLLAVDSTQETGEVINGSEHHGHAAYEFNHIKHG
jgi:hypothetical protein